MAEGRGCHGEQTIELDCAPGFVRPSDLIGDVIEGTGLPERSEVSSSFGNWTWDYSDIDPEVWREIRKVTGSRVKELYKHGVIRYGSW